MSKPRMSLWRRLMSMMGPWQYLTATVYKPARACQGTLAVGPIKFNPFELYGTIRVPIVFLSACETHTLEGMESSVASAFLFMGARSVLGTLAPINGVNAGILIGRFCLRFSEFIPSVKATIPWSQVVTGMLRMSYLTDVLRELQRQFSFADNLY